MTPEQRESLRKQLEAFEAARAKIETARKPLDEALFAIEEAREVLLEQHDAEIVGRCETCMQPIFSGERGHYDGDVYLCEAHSPTWAESRAWAIDVGEDGWDEPDGKAQHIAACDERIAAGEGDTKNVWEL